MSFIPHDNHYNHVSIILPSMVFHGVSSKPTPPSFRTVSMRLSEKFKSMSKGVRPRSNWPFTGPFWQFERPSDSEGVRCRKKRPHPHQLAGWPSTSKCEQRMWWKLSKSTSWGPSLTYSHLKKKQRGSTWWYMVINHAMIMANWAIGQSFSCSVRQIRCYTCRFFLCWKDVTSLVHATYN